MKLLLFFIILSFSNLLYSVEISSAINCLTSKCHSNLFANKFMHSPLKAHGCVVCHELLGNRLKDKKLPSTHPNIALNLGSNQLPVCQKCHVEWEKKFSSKTFFHSAISKLGCTSCHNPHGGDNPKFLKEKAFNQELCISCHKKNGNWEKGDKDKVHRAINVKDKCLNCHEIHSSNHQKLLKEEPVDLCLKCHADIVATNDKNLLHTPVRKGECLKCHSPHYASHENLLEKKHENEEGYVKNVEDSFQLCFSCHSPMKNSNFRNGEKNLHNTHVLTKFNGSERGCIVCHAVHVSTQHMLIQTKFTYKKFTLPIVYKKTENGGNCTTACHSNKGYDRVSPVANKEGR
jgi:predicted CXXCH cytochrome family protein